MKFPLDGGGVAAVVVVVGIVVGGSVVSIPLLVAKTSVTGTSRIRI